MTGFVIMGVAGCGKTSVGQGISRLTGVPFVDGDDLHPKTNIAKMSQGIPLDDNDRAPWLGDVGRMIGEAGGDLVIGCSALKRIYRDWVRQASGAPVYFLHLHAEQEVIARRMEAREGHFMPPSLLDSQFAALEFLDDDELGRIVPIERPLEAVINDAALYVKDIAG